MILYVRDYAGGFGNIHVFKYVKLSNVVKTVFPFWKQAERVTWLQRHIAGMMNSEEHIRHDMGYIYNVWYKNTKCNILNGIFYIIIIF